MKRYILEFTVFVCGALVMIFEIIGSRLLSPFIGASTYVWTSLIGIILAALSLGYWLGGRWADRHPDVKILAGVIFAAGGMVSLTILLQSIVLSFIAESRLILELKSVLAALLLFAPASVLLGFVTPYAVKLKMQDLADAGKTVGRLYALSTIGSICGTFLAGFFLIPFVGSTRSLYLIGGGLIGLSLLLAPFAFSRINFNVLILFILGVAGSELQAFYLYKTADLYDFDTRYSRVQVFKSIDKTSDRPIRAMATDPFFTQSARFLDSEELVLEYTKYYHLVRHFKPDFKRSLMIGGAGYSFPKDYLRRYPEASMDVVEIDPQMTEIARRFFGLKEDSRLNIIHRDGRVFLNRAGSGQYDAVLIDAFGSLFSVPFQLTTLEAVRHVDRVLNDEGVVIFNLGAAIRGNSSRFLQAELATYRQVFPQVFLFKIKPDYADERLQNLIIVACKSNLEISLTSRDPEIAGFLMNLYKEDLLIETPPLTDDLAPVEYYNSFAQSVYQR